MLGGVLALSIVCYCAAVWGFIEFDGRWDDAVLEETMALGLRWASGETAAEGTYPWLSLLLFLPLAAYPCCALLCVAGWATCLKAPDGSVKAARNVVFHGALMATMLMLTISVAQSLGLYALWLPDRWADGERWLEVLASIGVVLNGVLSDTLPLGEPSVWCWEWSLGFASTAVVLALLMLVLLRIMAKREKSAYGEF